MIKLKIISENFDQNKELTIEKFYEILQKANALD
jgi:hypothetical protein